MLSHDEHDAIGRLYDAAMGEASWVEAGQSLAELLEGSALNLFHTGPSGIDVTMIATHGYTLDQLKQYADHFAVHDLWTRAALQGGKFDHGVIGSQIVPDSALEKSLFYNEFLKPVAGDSFRFLGAMQRTEDGFAVISTHRTRSAPDFGPKQQRLMTAMLPHLARALEMRRRLSPQGETDRSGTILQNLPQPIVQLGPSGRVVMANAAAERILRARDGLWVGASGMLAVSAAERRRFDSLIRSAASVTAGNSGNPGGFLTISRPSGRYSYRCLVAPLGRDRVVLGPHEAAALLFITDPEDPVIVDPGAVASLLDLTPAEARVAASLAMGERLATVAERLQISYNTARTLLARATAKVGAAGQGDLVRIILTTVPRYGTELGTGTAPEASRR